MDDGERTGHCILGGNEERALLLLQHLTQFVDETPVIGLREVALLVQQCIHTKRLGEKKILKQQNNFCSTS
jgi:hypothetical protein